MTRRAEISPETARIQAAYALREEGEQRDRLSLGRRAMRAERDRMLAEALDRHLTVPLEFAKVLDVGCGDGSRLDWLCSIGAKGQNLSGVDLRRDQIEQARRLYPDFHLTGQNAEVLPFASGTFDLVMVMTVFSSILDPAMAGNVAAEIHRVLKSGGLILWYDIRYPNPWNRNVQAIGLKRVRELFPGLTAYLRTASLIPQLARALDRLNGSRLPAAYDRLTTIPMLRSHLLGVLTCDATGSTRHGLARSHHPFRGQTAHRLD